MDRSEMVRFVRDRGLGVVATVAADGTPEAALVGLAATDDGDLLFDTTEGSRKAVNLRAHPRVAVVLGGADEQTLQVEGDAVVLVGAERERALAAYVAQWPDGADRADDPGIVLVRVRPEWARHSDYRPGTFGSVEVSL